MVHEDKHADKHTQGAEDSLPLGVVAGYYLVDDWEDNLMSGRDLRPEASDYRYRIAQTFRPEWTTVSGSPSASGGKLVMPAGNVTIQHVETSSTFTVGSWEVKWKNVVTPTTGHMVFHILYQDANNQFYHPNCNYIGNPYFNFVKCKTGAYTTLIASTWAIDDAEHTSKITRDMDGNFALYLDGTLKGTTTDSWLPAVAKIGLKNMGDKELTFDNLRVFGGTVVDVKETKRNGLHIECALNGTGTETDPYRPAVYDTHNTAFFHLDSAEIDYTIKIARVWVNKLRTDPNVLDSIKATYTVLEETGA